jgi:hypothetical protein
MFLVTRVWCCVFRIKIMCESGGLFFGGAQVCAQRRYGRSEAAISEAARQWKRKRKAGNQEVLVRWGGGFWNAEGDRGERRFGGGKKVSRCRGV